MVTPRQSIAADPNDSNFVPNRNAPATYAASRKKNMKAPRSLGVRDFHECRYFVGGIASTSSESKPWPQCMQGRVRSRTDARQTRLNQARTAFPCRMPNRRKINDWLEDRVARASECKLDWSAL